MAQFQGFNSISRERIWGIPFLKRSKPLTFFLQCRLSFLLTNIIKNVPKSVKFYIQLDFMNKHLSFLTIIINLNNYAIRNTANECFNLAEVVYWL